MSKDSKAAQDNRSNQLNPTSGAYWSSRDLEAPVSPGGGGATAPATTTPEKTTPETTKEK